MPITSGKAVGSQSVAKAGVNLEEKLAALGVGQVFTTQDLVTAGMPKLTWLLVCGQAHSIQVQPQVAFRRVGVGFEAYEFLDAGPVTLVTGANPFVLELNAPAQAMRLAVTNPATAPGNATQIIAVLMASG